MLIKVKTALISVFKKDGVLELAEFLMKNDVKIISTGGTFKLLSESGIKAIEISEYTNFPEMMDGRLKTLHPKIHGGLLGRESDAQVMATHEIEKIDLVIINLYPFEETVLSGGSEAEIIEKIDIGGPSMVRSSAKNFKYTTVITSPDDYSILREELSQNTINTTYDFRLKMATKAFMLTGYYDSVISSWFMGKNGITLPREFSIPVKKTQVLRYGENPHQKAASYKFPISKTNGILAGIQLNGKELSYNNIYDADSAYEVASSFEKPCVSIIKHNNPCGIAVSEAIEDAYKMALQCDPRSAFGGIVGINRSVSEELAEALKSHFFEVIIAPKFEKQALEILQKKPSLRLLECPTFKTQDSLQIKGIHDGLLIQDCDSVEIVSSDAIIASKSSTIEFKIEDAIFAFRAVKFFKSNAIIITHGSRLASFGVGQTSRIDSMEIACKKLLESGIDPSKCILASDAFFPFSDNIEMAYKAGIRTAIAPMGSVKDEEVKECAKRLDMNLIFMKTRHFKH